MGFLVQWASPLPQLIPDKRANPGLATIQFQFQPQGLAINEGAAWTAANAQGRDHPILQFARGQQTMITFEAKLFAETITDNIDDKITAMRNSSKQLAPFGRPPVWTFVWGSIINETVVVESVGNIRYDAIRQDGSARGVLFAITLLKYVPFDIALTDPNAPLGGTFFTRARHGDLWEDVALREYNDPLMGDLLRRRNPDLAEPGDVPGRVLSLPPASTLRLEAIEPLSIPLRRTSAGLALRQGVYELRGATRPSAIVRQ